MSTTPNTCARCDADLATHIHTMSRFNTDIICIDCEKVEMAHPRYAEAQEAELAAVKRGDFNFPGIGLPDDLRRKP